MTVKYPVNEMFYSIQGEGAHTGKPSVFVRLQGCDVGCPWCDTKHTWNLDREGEVSKVLMLKKEDEAESWAYMTPAEIIEAACALVGGPLHWGRRIVITGGEPFDHHLTDLCEAILSANCNVQVETSGTSGIPETLPHDVWLTLSPKIGMPGGRAVRPEALMMCNEIKMPVGKEADIAKLDSLLDDLPYANRSPSIWLQPLSQSPAATKLCIETAKARNWNLSLQTHKYCDQR
jgi:7-carboxy-7-deazaguanine synthase